MTTENIVAMQIFADNVANMFWNRAKRAFPDIGIIPEVKLNKRLTSTAGRAFLERDYIDLSVYLLGRNTDTFKKEIIPHELCHMIAWRVYGDKGHGKAWYAVMKHLGVNGKRCHNMISKSQAERGMK